MPSPDLTNPNATSTDAVASKHVISQPCQNDYKGKPGQWKKVHVCDLTNVYVEPDSSQPTAPDDTPEQPQVKLQRRQELENLIKANPTNVDLFLELAAIYRTEDKPSEAKRVLKKAREIFPDEEKITWELEEATLARSLQQFREVTELATRMGTAESDRELQRSQQDWALRRIEICEARLRRDPSQTHLVVPLAEAMYEAEKYEKAYKLLSRVLNDSAISPGAHLIRGKCLLALKRDIDAMVEFRACALSRAVVAPVRMRLMALRALCDTAERLGIVLSAKKYQEHLKLAEEQLAQSEARNAN